MSSNRYLGRDFRDAVLGRMHAEGLTAAGVLDRYESAAIRLPGKANFITGLSWGVMTRAAHPMELSEALNHAASLASRLSSERFAVVLDRRRHPIGQTYALTTLDQLIALMKAETAPTLEEVST